MATLTTTITEALTLNGKDRGSTNTLTITGIDNVFHRIVTLADDMANATLVSFKSLINVADGAIDRTHVKYLRVTNLDGANPVILNIQQSEDEGDGAGDKNLGVLLSAGKSFMMGEAKESIDVGGGANDIDALTDLHDVESIMADPLSEAVQVEIFIAMAVA